MTGEFDYLIVGGGSAGCVLAARLSEDPGVRVALLEAGGEGRGPLVDIPAGTVAMLPTRLNNWAFETVPQPGLNGRRGYQPRGKGLGGSSAINAMVYVRGHQSDFDRWAALGNPGWGYDDVLPYFRKAEDNERLGAPYHGQGGPLAVSDSRTESPYHRIFLKAAREAGFALNPDFNGADQEGMGIYQVTQRNGRRCSAAHAYLHPLMRAAQRRPNLTVYTRALAERIVFEGRRAVGLQFVQQGTRQTLRARREVIVSAGALQSPQLLMCSGIGDAQVLGDHGIARVAHLPGVGLNLQDHIDLILSYRLPDTALLGLSLAGTWRLAREARRYRRERRGMLATNYAEAGGFVRLRPDSPAPEIQFMLITGIVEDHARRLRMGHGVSLHVTLLRPASRGAIGLNGPTMATPPRIDPSFYADPTDLETMVQGFKLGRRLMSAPAFASRITKELHTAQVRSDDDIRAALRARSDTVYHPVGTCRMGRDALAVVDAELRVHGMQGLRVVDASVMPTIVGGNTNAATIMIAEKAADLIRHGPSRPLLDIAGAALAHHRAPAEPARAEPMPA
jgi:choline dehydrogenase-like flavoprotein